MPDVVLIARCPEHGLHGGRGDCFVCGGPVEQVAMVPAATTSDPRQLGGDIAGPGGPYERDAVVVDPRRSVADRLWAYLPLPCPIGGIGDLDRWTMVSEPPPIEELLASAAHVVRHGRDVFAQIDAGDFGDIDTLQPRRRRRATPDEFQERREVKRRAAALDDLAAAIDDSAALTVPPPVERIELRGYGLPPKLPAAAFELARQVYYLQHGSLRDCARAVIAAGLSDDTDDVTKVRGRLKNWWAREQWPKRPASATFAIRDANHDGGLYRSTRTCIAATVGHGPAPKGKACVQSALPDSDYCFHHDPRSEYEALRRRHAEHLRAGRLATMVPLEPFQIWCEAQRRRMLEQERGRRPVHPNARGWGLLAAAMGVDQSILRKLMIGKHSSRGRPPVTMIKGATVARYVAPLGVEFRDIYGYDPPGAGGASLCCPQCGGKKNHQSEFCRRCYEASLGKRCAYVKRSGERCVERTADESGLCHKCRRVVFRVPRPRYKRPSSLTPERLILALSEYRDVPIHAWVAKRMWAVNAGDIRSAYRHRKSLTAQLVKEFRKRGWMTAEDAERAHAALVAEHGDVAWPAAAPSELEADGMLPFAPFLAWLRDRQADVVTYRALADRTGLNADRVSEWLRGVGEGADKTTVRRATVDRALTTWGDGTTFADVYIAAAGKPSP